MIGKKLYSALVPYQCCGPGSIGSVGFYCKHPRSVIICKDLPSIFQAKKVRKTFISNVCEFFCDFLALKTEVNVPLKNESKKTFYWHHESH